VAGESPTYTAETLTLQHLSSLELKQASARQGCATHRQTHGAAQPRLAPRASASQQRTAARLVRAARPLRCSRARARAKNPGLRHLQCPHSHAWPPPQLLVVRGVHPPSNSSREELLALLSRAIREVRGVKRASSKPTALGACVASH
jgi:hypothetical protein